MFIAILIFIIKVIYCFYSKNIVLKILPAILLAISIAVQALSIRHVLEFILYALGDYYLFYVNSMADSEYLNTGIMNFSLAHLIAIHDLELKDLDSDTTEHLIARGIIWFICILALVDYAIGIIRSQDLRNRLKFLYISILAYRLVRACSVYFITGEVLPLITIGLFCISDLLVMYDILWQHNRLVQYLILNTYWSSLILRAREILS